MNHVMSQAAALVVFVLSWFTGLIHGISLMHSRCLDIGPVAVVEFSPDLHVGCAAGLLATACLGGANWKP